MSSLPWFNKFNTELPVLQPNQLSGKVALVTGSTAGIGFETAKQLASAGATVVLTARSKERGDVAKRAITSSVPDSDVRVVELDLADLHHVDAVAERLEAMDVRTIDLLVLNAGCFPNQVSKTKDGLELMFGTHHVGHFHLFHKVEPLLGRSSAPRVVVTASALMAKVSQIIYVWVEAPSLIPKDYELEKLYAQSKLANVLFARELQRRHPRLVVSVNAPGLVRTNLLGATGPCDYCKSIGLCFEPEEGASVNVLGCVGPADRLKGQFVLPRGVVADWDRDVPKNCQDAVLAGELWAWTEKAIANIIKA